MKYSPIEIIVGLLKTSLLLIVLEIINSAVLTAFGFHDLKPAFNVLIVLYLAFKLDTPAMPYLILVTQYVHSIFSIEGWAVGTLTGVLIALSVRYVKDMLNFSTAISTMIVVQIFQVAWFVLMSLMLSIKMGKIGVFFSIFWAYLPESIVLSIISPFFFKLLDRFWTVKRSSLGATL